MRAAAIGRTSCYRKNYDGDEDRAHDRSRNDAGEGTLSPVWKDQGEKNPRDDRGQVRRYPSKTNGHLLGTHSREKLHGQGE